ncbi:hypothetical protein [Mycobacteroides franklinii]|uniref:Uncharacterized protein n=1 Tax=Mycobacteroides franklinii TaxID=948102 RepID=A0A1S1LDR2_9MYCO|nr:hypothetical protein [Mycobacteroides franklinii]OHU30926.1 hypothetical protein BKG76_04240 [Mycobacteroides franklinii]TDZ41802.1 hypothetical protein CCUG64054_01836 [Mycobacteroides franklinii]TDZ51950.1 hypothetical protein CCUG63697_00421 [Mycobacteroides franklinii]TDZ55357.1 hypothetical protein CCUG63696_01839 [Mycobacteroides franklinii]TDZ62298.1 hypothetical protein CCUG63695_01763 [Mycobacteroides franklinii]
MPEETTPAEQSAGEQELEPVDPIIGKVADIVDRYSVLVNKGDEAGVEVGMIFSVIGATGTAVRDPETGEDLGTLPIEKARIRVTEVYSKFCQAETYRITEPAVAGLISDILQEQWPGTSDEFGREQFTLNVVPTPTVPEAANVHIDVGDYVCELTPAS